MSKNSFVAEVTFNEIVLLLDADFSNVYISFIGKMILRCHNRSQW